MKEGQSFQILQNEVLNALITFADKSKRNFVQLKEASFKSNNKYS